MPASFYDDQNEEGRLSRQKACDAALADLMEYMNQEDGRVRVAAFDATNSTRERRRHIKKTIQESGPGVKVICLESICDQEEVSLFVMLCLVFPVFLTRLRFMEMSRTQEHLIDSHSPAILSANAATRREHSQSQTEYTGLSRHGSGSSHG